MNIPHILTPEDYFYFFFSLYIEIITSFYLIFGGSIKLKCFLIILCLSQTQFFSYD